MKILSGLFLVAAALASFEAQAVIYEEGDIVTLEGHLSFEAKMHPNESDRVAGCILTVFNNVTVKPAPMGDGPEPKPIILTTVQIMRKPHGARGADNGPCAEPAKYVGKNIKVTGRISTGGITAWYLYPVFLQPESFEVIGQ